MHVHANESDIKSVSANTVSSSVLTAAYDTSPTASYTVTGIENSEQLANLAPFEIVRRSSQNTEPLFYHVYNNNLLTVNAIITDSDGHITTQTLPVSWSCWDNNTTVTDTTVCGEYIETGIIKLPDTSYKWGEGVLSALSLPVRVYDPEEPVEIVELEEVWNEFDTAFTLEQNGSIEELLQNNTNTISLQTAWPCYDADGNEYLCPVVYNPENVKEDTVGIYDITVTFEEPLNCRFSDTLTVPSYSIPVTVQAPGQPRLDLSYISPNYDFIIFPWNTSGINLNTMEVWMSENDGEWRMLELDWEAYIYDTMLNLYAFLLTEGSSYRIQVKYEDGQTGIASFTYEWDLLSNKEYVEGDRDGGDTDGNPPDTSTDDESTDITPPDNSADNENTDITPPDISADNENTSETDNAISTPEKEHSKTGEDNTSNKKDGSDIKKADTSIQVNRSATEKAVENAVTTAHPLANTVPSVSNTPQPQEVPSAKREEPYLFGSEITLMLENLDTARFSAGTIMLDIPKDTITSLDISDTDRLLVTILPLENNGFSIDILINDITITTVSSMQISLPYQSPENTIPVLINEDNKKIASGNYKPDTGLVTFTLQETGTFYIKDEDVPMQDTFTANTLTVTELSTHKKDNSNSIFKLIAIVTPLIICSAAATIFVYTKKRRP